MSIVNFRQSTLQVKLKGCDTIHFGTTGIKAHMVQGRKALAKFVQANTGGKYLPIYRRLAGRPTVTLGDTTLVYASFAGHSGYVLK